MPPINQGTFTIDSTGSTLTIGEGHSSLNQIPIIVTNKGASQPKVRVTVTVKCGTTPEALLDATTARVVASASYGSTTDNLSAVSSAADSRSWQTSSRGVPLDADKQLTIKLSGFESNTPPGDALVDVVVQIYKDGVWTPAQQAVPEANRTIRVTKKPSGKVTDLKIHYFTVNPDYVLHAGETPVTLSFYVTGFESLVLFRNNQEVENWPSNQHPKNADGSITGTFSDKPSITTAYRLEGRSKAADDKTEKVRHQNVQVISPGWNQIHLPQGYPARLFVNSDFNPTQGKAQSDRLYGIFIDKNGDAALYSSATGVDDWRLEPGDFPQGMAMSPGVAYHNKLWLIGGSCVDPASPGSEVWCYQTVDQDSSEDSKVRNWVKQKMEGDFPARMGHACVVSQGQLWVLGGYSSPNALNDVWRINDDVKGKPKWESVATKCGWQGRVNLAAASFKTVNDDQEIWIYGGSLKPQSGGLYDLWSTQNGKDWSKLSTTIVPDPGTPLGSTLVVYPQSVSAQNDEGDRLFLLGSFLEWAAGVPGTRGNRVFSSQFEWHGLNLVWEETPVFNGWQQFRGENFYMQAVTFNGFLFVWSLQPGISHTLKLNILVS